MKSETKDFLLYLIKEYAFEKGLYKPLVNRNIYLSYEEAVSFAEEYVSTVFVQPYVSSYVPMFVDGYIVFEMNTLGPAYGYTNKSFYELSILTSKLLSRFYNKRRSYVLHNNTFKVDIFSGHHIRVILALNNNGSDYINKLMLNQKKSLQQR